MRPVVILACLLMISVSPAAAQDPFAGKPRGKLTVKLELAGSGRVDMPNGVEWAAIEAKRSMTAVFEMVDVGSDGLPIVSAKPAGSALSPNMNDLKDKIDACGGDHACLSRTMMEFAASGSGGGNVFQQMTGQQPGRFLNFAGDRSGTCATGTLTVKDALTGVVIPPPLPARPYSFTRSGSTALPAGDARLTDTACGIEMTFDTATNTMSLRLPVSLAVGVSLGAGAFTNERAVTLVEGRQFLTLHDQPAGGPGSWRGAADIGDAGSASHNSGQVAASLKGRIAWEFSVD